MAESKKRRSSTSRKVGKAVERTVLSAVNGLIYAMDGAARPTMGSVARDLAYKKGKLELWRVRAIADEEVEIGNDVMRVEFRRHRVPILVIPPLMVRPYVYDLRPEHSMLRTLRNAGFDVFYIDFGVPDRADEGVRLDDYVLDYVPACVEQTVKASGSPAVSIVGYCMGGIFGLLHAGTFRDPRVKNLVTIGAPVNFDKMGAITVAMRLGVPVIDMVMDSVMDRIGNVPGAMSSLGFKVISRTRAVTKYADLLTNLYDEEYVRGFDAINTWVNDLIPYPKEAFKQMVKDVVYGNKLLTNELVFHDDVEGVDRLCDLKAISCPLLAFAGKSDNIAPPASTADILDLVGSRDKTLLPVPGGHVGVVGGSAAPKAVWQPTATWLAERSSLRA